MSDVFISYSREDSELVQALHERLERSDRDVWVDLDEIPPTADWLDEIKRAIEGAETFVFVISPDSISSEICQTELAHAAGHNKRIVPLVYREVDQRLVPEPLAARNWIFIRDGDDFEAGVATLDQALDTDLEWVREHTELLRQALAWEQGGRRNSSLLRGTELEEGERWLGSQPGGGQQPTTLHREFILAGRRAAGRRQRVVLGVVSVGLVVAVGLAVLALSQRNQAIEQRERSTSLQLAALADSQLKADPERSLLLATRALEESETNAAATSLQRALEASRVRAQFAGPAAGSEAEQEGGSTFAGHGITTLFSPDGDSIASYIGNGEVVIWDARTGEQKVRMQVPPEAEGVMTGTPAFSPDGLLLTVPYIHNGFVFDVRDGEPIERLTLPEGVGVNDVSFSPDGRLLASIGTDGVVRVWSRSTGELDRGFSGQRGQPTSGNIDLFHLGHVAWSPDGALLASIGTGRNENTARIWPLDGSGDRLVLEGHRGFLNEISFSPDSRLISTASEDDTARVWDARSGELLQSLGSGDDGFVNVAPFSPDGELIATPHANGTVEIWSREGELLHTLKGHRGDVINARFSPDGSLLATAGADDTARLWDPLTGRALAVLKGHTKDVEGVDFSPDGSLLSTASGDGTARVWSVDSGEEAVALRRSGADTTAMAVSSDDGLVATADAGGAVSVWRPRSGRLLNRLGSRGGPAARSLAFSPDGRLLVAVGGDSATRIWGLPGGRQLATLRGHSGQVNAVAVGPGGQPIITAGQDGEARLWTPAGRELAVLDGSGAALRSADVSPGGELVLTAGDDGTARIWDAGSGELRHELQGHSGTIGEASFSPSGELVVTASQDDTARIWEAASGAELAVLEGHSGAVNNAQFDAGGERVITASDDGTARIWDTESGEQLAELIGHTARVATASFNAEGDLAVTGAFDGRARVWEVASGDLVTALNGPGGFIGAARFGPDGGIALTAEDAAEALYYPCRLCLPLDQLEALAEHRVTRELTAEERRQFLEGD